MSTVVHQNLDGAIGLPMESMNAFLVGKTNEINMYCIDKFKCKEDKKITIKLLESQTREPNEIIGM